MPNEQPPRWLAALPALFGIGAKMGGSPQVGTGALKGAEHANLLAAEQQQVQVAQSQRQQQIDMQGMAMLAQEQARMEQAEARRQQAIKSSIDDLRAQKFPSRDDYEKAVGAHEGLLGQFFGVRPNTLRTMVPYNGPTVKARAYEAMEKITKQDNWADIVAGNGVILFDRDEDGIPENVPVGELIHLAEFPVARDPQTGKPMLPPKSVKPENIEEFDEAYKNTLAQWQAEGKDITSPRVRLAAQQAANKLIAESRKTTDPTLEAIRQLTLQNAGREPLEAVMGDDGKPLLVPRSQAAGRMPATSRERPTEDERKSAGWYEQMRDAANTIDALESKLTEQELFQLQTLPHESLVGMVNRNQLSEAAKRYFRAFTQFSEARLRSVSGAAISAGEYQSDRQTYGKQYGETPELAADRKRAREVVIRSTRTRAGAAMPRETGTPSGGIAIGSIQTLKSGKRVKVTKVNPDGTFEGTVVR